MTSTIMRFEFVDNAREEALSKKFVPKNTEKGTQWALSAFFVWRDKRNKCKLVPSNLLGFTDSSTTYCKWLSLYIAEL